VTGRLDAFEWRAPVERVGQLIEGDEKAKQHPALAAPEEKGRPVETTAPAPVEPEPAPKSPATETTAKPAAPAAPPETPVLAPVVDGTPPDIMPPKVEEPIRLPDDPGVEPQEDEAEKAPRRFRLF
jgi:HemY protein